MFLAAIGAWRTGGDRRVRDAAVAIATPAIAALVAGGWFYARNYSIYGSITGNGFIKPPLGAKPKRPFLDVATDIEFWRPLSRHIWDAFQGVRTLTPWNAWIGYAIEAPVLVGLGLLLCRRVRTGTRVERSNLAVWLALGGFAAVVVASLISFVAIGGNPHARYLFPALPIFGIAIALGYLALPRVVVTGAFVATAVVNVALLHRYVANNTGVRHKQIVSAEIEALRNAGLPGVRPLLVVAALVFAALVAIATIALWRAAGGDAQAVLAARSSGETGEEPEHGGVEGVGQLP